jgi:hypothetical protein
MFEAQELKRMAQGEFAVTLTIVRIYLCFS